MTAEVILQKIRETLEKLQGCSLSSETVACSLTRHLAKNTTLQAFKDELRRDVAIQRRPQTDMPIAVIGTAVGFDAPTTFHRAVRKWKGSTLGAYRLQRGKGNGKDRHHQSL